MPILVMVNLKGGVAKTTNAVAIAECLADAGRKVLVVDADHQCMASEMLLGEERLLQCERRGKTLHDLLAVMLDDEFAEGHLPHFIAEEVSLIGSGYPNLHLIPCSLRIDDFATNMAKARRGYNSVEDFRRELIKKRRTLLRYLHANYEYVVVDCPPSLALQVHEFLVIGDAFIIPSVPDRLSVRGSLLLLDRLRRSNLTRIQPLGTLWSLYREQADMHRTFVEHGRLRTAPLDQLPRPFDTVIPNASRIAASSVVTQRPASFSAKYTPPFAKLFRGLCEEVLVRLEDLKPAGSAHE